MSDEHAAGPQTLPVQASGEQGVTVLVQVPKPLHLKSVSLPPLQVEVAQVVVAEW